MNAATLFELDAPAPSHPATYTDALLLTMAKMLKGRERILDPFGGEGGIFQLEAWLPDAQFEATEIEQEWAAKHPKTTLGNALALPWADGYFNAICTSPTYGNRMGDTLLDDDKYTRMTYTAKLNRPLHPDNTGQLQWGPKYREIHQRAWVEARRVLASSSIFVLNIKDHIRNFKRIHVTDWHIECLQSLGFRMVRHEKIDVPSMKYGQNGELRVPYESVILFELERVP